MQELPSNVVPGPHTTAAGGEGEGGGGEGEGGGGGGSGEGEGSDPNSPPQYVTKLREYALEYHCETPSTVRVVHEGHDTQLEQEPDA